LFEPLKYLSACEREERGRGKKEEKKERKKRINVENIVRISKEIKPLKRFQYLASRRIFSLFTSSYYTKSEVL
jgi:hypothetical protein